MPGKQNPLAIQETEKEEKGNKLVKQNPLVVQETKEKEKKKGKRLAKQNTLVKETKEKGKKLVKQNSAVKEKNIKRRCPKRKPMEISQNKKDSNMLDIGDTGPQTTAHLAQKVNGLIRLRKTFEIENGLIMYTCQLCEDKHYSKQSLIRHWYKHTVFNPRLNCMVCRKSFSKHRALRIHSRKYHGLHVYKCLQCSLLFQGPNENSRHMLGHTQKCKYFCRLCGNGYKMFNILEFHILTAHVKGNKSIYKIDRSLINKFFVKMKNDLILQQ